MALTHLGRVSALVLFLSFLPLQTASAQSLDQQAWNSVWDRLEKILPKGNENNIVTVLDVPVPATWANRDLEGLRQLQRIAGAIPDETFTIDPSRNKLFLHQMYANYVLDVDLPQQNEKDRKAFLDAEARYKRAFDEYMKTLDVYETKWEKEKKDLTDRKEPVDSQARLDFRKKYLGLFRSVQSELDAASSDAQKFAPVAGQWAAAVRELRDELTSAQSDLRGVWDYDGSLGTLTAMKNDCAVDGPGWEKLTFDRSVQAEHIRTSNWNGGGGWGGTFFNLDLGGGGSDYQHVITTANESVALKLCNLTYISLSPSTWFDISILQAIDSGQLSLKTDSPSRGRRILGPKGSIPRLVKGAIVARSINFEAKLGTTQMTEYKKNIAGSAGVSIGPWHIGGSGGGSEFSHEYTSQDGGYGRSTAFTVPVVIAIITEPTIEQTPVKGTKVGQ